MSERFKRAIARIPVVGDLARTIHYYFRRPPAFSGSAAYWERRYAEGGNSGAGSYNELAQFKAEILNDFVARYGVKSVIEYGCGDGNQLRLATYPRYLGFDVSQEAVRMCRQAFAGDDSKDFKPLTEFANETAELVLSLDVIYHLVEDDVFEDYMRRLFASSTRFVAIYSSNMNEDPPGTAPHVRHRRFSHWIEANLRGWNLVGHVPNRYPIRARARAESFADFYFYAKTV